MKPNGFEHPKVERFADELDIRLREAWGMLDRLFGLTQQYAERGGIGRVFTDKQLARRLDWTGEGERPEILIQALESAGFIDSHPVHRFVVHDWPEHAPEYTKKKCRGANGKPGVGWAEDDKPTESQSNDSDRNETEMKPEDSGDDTDSVQIKTGPSLPSPSLPSPSVSMSSPSGSDPPPESRVSKSRKREPPDPEDLEDARHLARLVQGRYPTTEITEARLRAWAAEIRKVDAPHATKRLAMDWLYSEHNEGQYAIQVRSGKAFREKWQSGQIEAAHKRSRASRPTTPEDAAAEAVRLMEAEDASTERGEIGP